MFSNMVSDQDQTLVPLPAATHEIAAGEVIQADLSGEETSTSLPHPIFVINL